MEDEDFFVFIFILFLSLLLLVLYINYDSEITLSPKELSEILKNTDQTPCVRDKLSKYFSCEGKCEPLSRSEMEYTLSICKGEKENKWKEEENRKLFEMQRSVINRHGEDGK
ncbi:hypothetical protein [Dickeya fangzhongdai]|uniref:hypothetical protein n=1 Tax=Dickeya fangzhongdai TaxID=1778540 RepID=UPI002B263C82|nr:hypothetical protein [Dickeya fangzhongdai]WOY03091.1 hypothetical protein OGM21_14525 [Dickeya fangzhongdai]